MLLNELNLIILPGNNSSNLEWLDALTHICSRHFRSVVATKYEHWQTHSSINFIAETAKVLASPELQNSYIILGKSAGAILALDCASLIRPVACVILGLPILAKAIGEQEISSSHLLQKVQNCPAPLLILQEEGDPYGSFNCLNQYMESIKGNQQRQILKIPGNNHSYSDVNFIYNTMRLWLMKTISY